jgi:hypothetical protein
MVVFPRYPLGPYQDITNYALVFGPSDLRIRAEAGLCGPVLETSFAELLKRWRPTKGLFQL